MSEVAELVSKLTRPPKVLVIEDDEGAGSTLCALLSRSFNCKVTWAKCGEDAVESVKHESYDLALLDLLLPSMSSYDVLRNIKSITSSLPVVIVTGWPGSDEALKVARLGVVGLVVKPFTVGDIEEMFRLFKIRAAKTTCSPELPTVSQTRTAG